MAKKAAVGKKKGPKGKKARAKAKLERQWGEELTEDQVKAARKHRRGTTIKQASASKSQPKNITEPSHLPVFSEKTTEHEESDEDMDDDEQENSGDALNALLQAIQKNRKLALDDDNMSDSSEHDKDRKSKASNRVEEEEEDDIALSQEEQQNCDLFGRHFNQTALPETDSKSAETMIKAPVASLDDSVEMHVSSPLVLDLKASSGSLATKENAASANESDLNWRRLTTKSFAGIRKTLSRAWQGSEARDDGSKVLMTPLQRVLFPCMARYADVLMTAESSENREQVSSLLRLHVVNHVLTSRGRIQRHNQRLRDLAKTANSDTELLAAQGKFRDQGYTRPTVLILMPTRGTCYAFVQGILRLLGGGGDVDNLDRFEAEFGAPPPPPEDEVDPEAKRRRKMVLERKGKEWLEIFGDDVNDDDDFKIGISLTPKAANRSSKQQQQQQQPGKDGSQHDEYTNVYTKLFTDFYKSDIILASPLALKLLSATSDSEDADYDFLSSIEICILSRMDVLLMQNMDHVTSVMALLNQQPKNNTHDIDFSRVREYCLVGQAASWRQLVVCSNIIDPQILSVFKRHAKSFEGAVKMKRITTSMDSSIAQVVLPISQVFQRVPCSSLAEQGNAKLKYLADKLLPTLRKQKHTMIFVPSYFDFISLRNMLLKREVDFVSVSEYSRISEVSRSRARFLQGRQPIMLYTGRAHYFHRHTIKGVKHLIFFGLPEQAAFYVDLIHSLGEGLDHGNSSDSMSTAAAAASWTCLALFTKYEAHALERIAGRDDCRKMLQSDKTAFAFTSG